ncbi:probable GTP diphosphokinase CRSH1, chloroplastic [Dendrobium catenatum]|uniref:GTP diphosphokinase n=1 Tax=Dendrobium catenatum TaxID=906689 RepID=A0A2I0WM40_9ASPA|nr:probable GTP diphosphokinase CRSH1, chloroplastic [Dendrobium catenatum]PKU76732.1 putative calcium-binding protein CML29 [Dendrobium catenatum]
MSVSTHRIFHSTPLFTPGTQRAYPPPHILVVLPSHSCYKPHFGVRSLAADSPIIPMAVDLSGGKMVVELVGAFNDLTGRMGEISTTFSSQLLFKSLKLTIPLLNSLPHSSDGRPPLSRALSIACLLADLHMDAEVISAGLLREAVEAGVLTMLEVKSQISSSTGHLLHENLRMKYAPSKVDVLDDESASALRKFCLAYYDIRAVILELVIKLDTMRNIDHLLQHQQQTLSLEVMKIYAPLAHAVGAVAISLELEDIAFQYLFPYSYNYIDAWLRSHETENMSHIKVCKDELIQVLNRDSELEELVDDISIKSRYKSRFSTMKKLLRDGRRPEEVNDLLGLRIILNPKPGSDLMERGLRACYRTSEVIRSMWKEITDRTKDYITNPKANGYRSLHLVVDVGKHGMVGRALMEIQIRTKEMDLMADAGAAAHSLYKGGLTDPQEAKRLKAIMLAAAELAALRLRDLPMPSHRRFDISQKDRVFSLLDKNGDGRISIDELTEVMEDLGAGGNDAQDLMKLLDTNSDGSLSSDEFDLFQKQIELMRSLEERDDHYKAMLGNKLEITDSTGLIQVYRKELGDKLTLNSYFQHDDQRMPLP